jgi:hypothetical protein
VPSRELAVVRLGLTPSKLRSTGRSGWCGAAAHVALNSLIAAAGKGARLRRSTRGSVDEQEHRPFLRQPALLLGAAWLLMSCNDDDDLGPDIPRPDSVSSRNGVLQSP